MASDPVLLILSSMMPGQRVSQTPLAEQLDDHGTTSGRGWTVTSRDGVIDTLSFTTGFPQGITIQGLFVGQKGRTVSDVYPQYQSFNHRGYVNYNWKYIAVAERQMEILTRTGRDYLIEEIVIGPLGRLQRDWPADWQQMLRQIEHQAERQAEMIRTAPLRRAREERQRNVRKRIASLDDPDERLDYWAANTDIWGQPAPWLVSYAAWLRAGSADRWHEAARHWNWDYGVVPLRWIVTRPNCEAATALHIFYLGQPYYAPRTDDEEGQLIDLIRCRWATGGFVRGSIAYEVGERLPVDRYIDEVPPAMRVSLSGRIMEDTERYADGFPMWMLPEDYA